MAGWNRRGSRTTWRKSWHLACGLACALGFAFNVGAAERIQQVGAVNENPTGRGATSHTRQVDRVAYEAPFDVDSFDQLDEVIAMQRAAESRSWRKVSEGEIRAARARGISLRASLGAKMNFHAGGNVYEVPDSEIVSISREINEGRGSFDSLPTETIPYLLVGGDDRVPVPPQCWPTQPSSNALFPGVDCNVFQDPYRQLVKVGLFDASGTFGQACSGAFFGPRHVVTSGHCFWPISGFLPVSQVQVDISASGAFERATVNASSWWVMGSGDTDDLAVLVLPDISAVTNTGYYRWQYTSSANEGSPIWVRGYPGAGQLCYTTPWGPNPPFCGDADGNPVLYESSCNLTEVDQELEYPCDTSGGMSGGPVVRYVGQEPRLIGVHRGEDDDILDNENRGVRLTPFKVSLLCTAAINFPSATVPFDCGP